MKPTIGRIVIYNTTEGDRKMMQEKAASGTCNVQNQLPAIIVATFGEKSALANLKVELDGVGCMWKTSIAEGTEQGQWQWPVIIAKNINTGVETPIDINKKADTAEVVTKEVTVELPGLPAEEPKKEELVAVEQNDQVATTSEQPSTRPKRSMRDLKTN